MKHEVIHYDYNLKIFTKNIDHCKQMVYNVTKRCAMKKKVVNILLSLSLCSFLVFLGIYGYGFILSIIKKILSGVSTGKTIFALYSLYTFLSLLGTICIITTLVLINKNEIECIKLSIKESLANRNTKNKELKEAKLQAKIKSLEEQLSLLNDKD